MNGTEKQIMKKIIEKKWNATDNTLEGYDELVPGEKFIYADGTTEIEAIKINDTFSAFIMSNQKLLIAKRFKNCLSAYDSEKFKSNPIFATLEEALKWCAENK